MDALALLCTLHADGPRSTRRLRLLGVHTLEALRELPLAQLADVLDTSNNGAERFLREAAILAKRVRHEAVEEAEPPRPARPPASEPATSPSAAASVGASGAGPARDPAAAVAVAEEPAPEPSRSLQRYVINPLVQSAVPSGPSTPLTSKPLTPLSATPLAAGGPLQELQPGLFEGLDADACQRLARSGVETVEDLARASGLDLALELGWAYDRVFHLKKEASHYVQSVPTAPAATRSAPPVDAEGPSGPFA